MILGIILFVVVAALFTYSVMEAGSRADDQSEETYNQLKAERERHASVERFKGRHR